MGPVSKPVKLDSPEALKDTPPEDDREREPVTEVCTREQEPVNEGEQLPPPQVIDGGSAPNTGDCHIEGPVVDNGSEDTASLPLSQVSG